MISKVHDSGPVPFSTEVHVNPDAQREELHSSAKKFHVDFKKFYGIDPTHVDRNFKLNLSEMSYLPKVDNPRADWVVTAALNSFRAFQSGEFSSVNRFATVGTGSGTDIIAALDTFPNLSSMAMTDLHNEVVRVAKSNVHAATEGAGERVKDVVGRIFAQPGDVLLPLKGQKPFDIIYENLPNIPLPDSMNTDGLRDGQTSATYVGDRTRDKVPSFVSAALLDLHYVCLLQAREFNLLNDTGAVLSSIGGRVPLETILDLADAAGYVGRVLSLSWKEQSEPESVIGGYAEHQAKGLGPFHFYPISVLERVFNKRTPAGAGLCAAQIKDTLLPDRLDAIAALRKHREGIKVGHTVIVMASVLKSIGPAL